MQDWGASFAAASTSSMNFYDEIMVPRLFEPWAELLLDQTNPKSGQAVLDVACGPGTVTRLAALRVGPTGRVVGCDLSPAMLELARSKIAAGPSAPIEYLECPADSLRVSDDAFDVVTCQQGLQFFPDRAAALVEMRRALRAGGKLGIAVWCPSRTVHHSRPWRPRWDACSAPKRPLRMRTVPGGLVTRIRSLGSSKRTDLRM